ncbi:MAG: hypothetical protein JXO22_17060 [Phycisphaerae bacterium]|nr:hypothetical protein [Phycisphaerae bacterium]
MPADQLQELLTRADASAGPPPRQPDDLARRARGVVRARRYRRQVLVSAAAVVTLMVGLSLVVRLGSPATSSPPPSNMTVASTDVVDTEALRAEILRLRAEVTSYQAVARRTAVLLEENQRLSRVRSAAAQVDPLFESRLELNQAAFVLVQQGDQLRRELNQRAPAIERYRETIRLFPNTTWAEVAAERLADLTQGEIS